MNAPHSSVSITGLLNERCYAVEGSTLRIYLSLSQPLPLGWSYIFSQVWSAMDYPGKRPVGIDDGALWIECPPEDVRACHLPNLEQAIEQTNARFHQQHRQKEMAAERQRELSRLTHMKLDELAKCFAPVSQANQFFEETSEQPRNFLGRLLSSLRQLFKAPAKGNRNGRLMHWKPDAFATQMRSDT